MNDLEDFSHYGSVCANDGRLATITFVLLAMMAVIASLAMIYTLRSF